MNKEIILGIEEILKGLDETSLLLNSGIDVFGNVFFFVERLPFYVLVDLKKYCLSNGYLFTIYPTQYIKESKLKNVLKIMIGDGL